MTEEEHEAFVCYMELRDNIETAQKQECYYVGQVHANMLQRDLDKRINGADGNCVGKYTYSMNPCLFDEGIWEQEEAREMLGDFINLIRSERKERLKKYPQYQKLKYRESKILKSHPFVQELIDNGKVSDKLELSHTQQQVLMNYIALQQKKAVFEMMETLLIGCRAGIECAKILQ